MKWKLSTVFKWIGGVSAAAYLVIFCWCVQVFLVYWDGWPFMSEFALEAAGRALGAALGVVTGLALFQTGRLMERVAALEQALDSRSTGEKEE